LNLYPFTSWVQGGALTSLTSLNLSSNSIGEEGAKAIAQSLTSLTSLDLSNNSIGDEGAKAIAQSLTSLTSLDLSNNSIGEEGAKAILDTWSKEERMGRLQILALRDNGDLSALLPKEALATADAQAVLAAYRSFRLAGEKETLRPLNEVKLLVVGNEAVGKTSLLRFLIEDKPRDPAEKKTPGIAQHEKIKTEPWSPQSCQVQLNVWDFGGQEMMKGTHRFFLTERSLYLLVLEDRREDDRSIYDWMKTIRNRGGNSPVIVIINKSDQGKQDLKLDETGLKESYDNIAAFLRTSTDPDQWAADSIAALRQKIVEIITKDDRLKHVRDNLPENWLSIKDRMRELAKQRSVLPRADFNDLCKNPGNSIEPITDEHTQRALLRLLHDLGTIIAHGLDPDAPAAQREITLLDPNWLTGAIYRILLESSSADQGGEFLRQDLTAWLDPGPYPPERHEFVLDMMQDEDIGLCILLDQNERRYLAPQALPASRPFLENWPEDVLRFRYVYDYLPPGLIPRFIVQSNRNLTKEKTRWRTGVILKARDCPVLVLADTDKKRVDIKVDGPRNLRRLALNVILDDLEFVHKLNREAKPDGVVPLPDLPEKHVSYKHLLKLERDPDFGSGHKFIPDGADHAYQVGELLEGVRRDESKQPVRKVDSDKDTKPHVVILIHGIRTQASWQNELRNTLEKEGFVVEPTNYQYYDLVRFLFPWQLFAGPVTNNITEQIRQTLAMNKGADCSIIAHSFGTFVLTRILRDNADLDFNRIIFCGSVVPQKFRFQDYRKRFEAPLLNEIGTRDFWPVFAEVVTFGYGAAGTYAFRRPGTRDRLHNRKAHSDFLNRDFCKKYWIPFLRDGTIIENDEKAEPPPWWLWAVSVLKIKYFLLAAAAILLYRWLARSLQFLGA
jgi:internalin A